MCSAHPLDQALTELLALEELQQVLPGTTTSRFAKNFRWSLASSRQEQIESIIRYLQRHPRQQAELEQVLSLGTPEDTKAFAPLKKALHQTRAFTSLHQEQLCKSPNSAAQQIRPPLRKPLATALRPVLPPVTPSAGPRALPKIGSMRGVFRNRKIMLTFNRTFWTITGNHGAHDVGLTINHEKATIVGRAYGDSLSLGFDWSPEKISQHGMVAGILYNMALDWKAGTAVGRGLGKGIRLQFSLDDGRITGWMPGGQVNLTLNEISGVLQGTVGGKFCQLTLTNVDLYDFLQHLYLFLEV